ncbi:MAG: hypothetical protein LBP62_01015 [Clostridiales bacterium]|jgi:hypothetical protein|nr:hypothetical protein [Clostridiales bacterium]
MLNLKNARSKFVNFFIVALLAIIAMTFSACSVYDGSGEEDKKPAAVTVSLNPNGGTLDKLTFVGFPGEPMNLPVPEREKHTFDKWYEGWSPISQTEFPAKDTQLTARYYTQEEYEQTIESLPSKLNEEYYDDDFSWGKSYEWIGWNEKDFTAENWDKFLWLQKNPNITMNLSVTLEARIGGGNDYAVFEITGANSSDVITYINVTHRVYTSYTISGTSTAKVLVLGNSIGCPIKFFTSNENILDGKLYYRNIEPMTITFIQPIGSLI